MNVRNYYKTKFANHLLGEGRDDPPRPSPNSDAPYSRIPFHRITMVNRPGNWAWPYTGPLSGGSNPQGGGSNPQGENPDAIIPDRPSWWPENIPWPPDGLNSQTIQQWIDPNLGPEFADFAFYSNIENGHGILWVYNPASNSFSSTGPIPILSGPGSINPPSNTDIIMPNGTIVYQPEPGQWVFVLPNGEVLSYNFNTSSGWIRLTGSAALNYIDNVRVEEGGLYPSYVYGQPNNNPLRIDKHSGNLAQQPRPGTFIRRKPRLNLSNWHNYPRFTP
jgi:hypothetical protein